MPYLESGLQTLVESTLFPAEAEVGEMSLETCFLPSRIWESESGVSMSGSEVWESRLLVLE